MTHENYLPCSAYEGYGQPDERGVIRFKDEASGEFFFAILDADGEVLLKSEGYPSEAPRDNGVESVLRNRTNRDFYSLKEEDGKYYMSLRAGNYREIARSCDCGSAAEAEALIGYLTGEQVRKKAVAEAVTPAEAESAREEDNYLRCKDYLGHARHVEYPDFATFQHSDGEHYFVVYNSSDEVAFRSEGYPTTAARDNGMMSVMKNRSLRVRYSVKRYPTGHYIVILKAGNHQEIARSCPYTSEEAAMASYPQDEVVVAAMAAERIVAPMEAPVEVLDPEDDYLSCKEYEGHDRVTTGSDFAKFQHSNGQFYFVVYQNDGDIAFRSEGHPTAELRDADMDDVLRNIGDPSRHETKRLGQHHYYHLLRDENGKEIGRSCLHKDAVVTPAAAAPMAPEPEPFDKADDYLLCKEYEGHARVSADSDFATFQHSNGQYYFVVYDKEGNVAFRSEGHPTAAQRDEDMADVARNLGNAANHETKRLGAKHYYHVLHDESGKEIGRSCLHEDAVAPVAAAPIAAAAIAAVVAPPAPEPEPVAAIPFDKADDYLHCKDYEGHARVSADSDFATFQHSNGQYYFVVYDKGGNVAFRSEGHPTAAQRDEDMADVARNLGNAANHETKRIGVTHYYHVLRDEKGKEIGRSCLHEDARVPTPEAAPDLTPAVALAAAAVVAPLVVPEPPAPEPVAPAPVVHKEVAAAEPHDPEDDYLACKEYEGHQRVKPNSEFAKFKHSNGNYYFVAYKKNGDIAYRSEGHPTAQQRDKDLNDVMRNIGNKKRHETKRLGSNHYYHVLRDEKGKEIGRSCLHRDEAAVPIVAAPIAAAAVAAAAPIVTAAAPIVAAAAPKVEIPKVAPVVEEAAAAGWFRWWMLLALLALLALYFLKDGCNKETAAVAPITVDTTATAVTVPADTVVATTPVPADPQLTWLYFDFDKSDLRDASKGELDKLAAILKAHPDYKTRLSAHTDTRGDNAYNEALSQRRVTAALSYLKAQNIEDGRIATTTKGERDNVAKNEINGQDSEAGRQYNRRVEIEILDASGKVLENLVTAEIPADLRK